MSTTTHPTALDIIARIDETFHDLPEEDGRQVIADARAEIIRLRSQHLGDGAKAMGPSFHSRMMNIRVGSNLSFGPGASAYKLGHRDARHAAAEIALEADALKSERDALQRELAELKGVVAKEQWTRLGDVAPPDHEPVLLYDPVSFEGKEFSRWCSCYYHSGSNKWDHDNWHGPKDAKPNDLWRRVALPEITVIATTEDSAATPSTPESEAT